MFVKICGQLEGKRDDTIIECDEVRFCPDVAVCPQGDEGAPPQDQELVMRLLIRPTNKRSEGEIEWTVLGDRMQVYLLNNDGKTIDKLW
jgi:hypothetical protein